MSTLKDESKVKALQKTMNKQQRERSVAENGVENINEIWERFKNVHTEFAENILGKQTCSNKTEWS